MRFFFLSDRIFSLHRALKYIYDSLDSSEPASSNHICVFFLLFSPCWDKKMGLECSNIFIRDIKLIWRHADWYLISYSLSEMTTVGLKAYYRISDYANIMCNHRWESLFSPFLRKQTDKPQTSVYTMSKWKTKENRLGFHFPFETAYTIYIYTNIYIYIDIHIYIYIYAGISILIYTGIRKTEVGFPWWQTTNGNWRLLFQQTSPLCV